MQPSLSYGCGELGTDAGERDTLLRAVAALQDDECRRLVIRFYENLLASQPHLRTHFEGFDIDRQASKLSSALRVLVGYANDPQLLGQEVIRLGIMHAGRGIGRSAYKAFAAVLAETLAESQSVVPVERAREIWLRELVAIAHVMVLAGSA